MQKVKIYALVDPRTDLPFYVGATIMKLSARLRAHCCVSSYYLGDKYRAAKERFVEEIKMSGSRPHIKLLEEVLFDMADKTEKYYYEHFIHLGYKLYQPPNQFNYQIQQSNKKINLNACHTL